jgi:hypothetical protein
MKLEFPLQIFKKCLNTKIHENPSSGSRVVPLGRRIVRKKDKETNMTKLIVAFRNFANAPKIKSRITGLVYQCQRLRRGCRYSTYQWKLQSLQIGITAGQKQHTDNWDSAGSPVTCFAEEEKQTTACPPKSLVVFSECNRLGNNPPSLLLLSDVQEIAG